MLHIESLENRQLFSASLHPAAKTKPTIPDIALTFTGTGTETKPVHAVGDLQVHITSESTTGALSGTFTNLSVSKTGNFTGKVTNKDAVTIKVIDSAGKTTFTFKGKYSAAAHLISGTYKGAATKTVKASSGIFSLSSAPT